MDDALPFVRIVVIHFDGGQMTLDCLHSLMATDWPPDRLEILLVDNGSLDDVVSRVRVEMPYIRVVEPLANTGFAGGCNLGIEAPGHFDLLALVNNDAVVSTGWLRPLVEALRDDARLGAACPKILFEGQFVEADVAVPDAAPIGRDPRTLGVRLIAARIDGVRDDGRLAFDEGFFPPEVPDRASGEEMAVWSWHRGRVRVRTAADEVPSSLCVRVVAPEPRTMTVGPTTVALDEHARWIEVPLHGPPFDVINNAGSALYEHGFGGDRGFLEADRGQYDEPADVFAWCGGAVLMRRDYLADVGTFDERLFLYYEDTDLSWRGRLRGWNYRYVPTSVVRHRHAQSSGVWSPTFRYYTERNRPLVLAKNAPVGTAVRAGGGLARRAVARTVRDVILRPLRLRMPQRAEAAHEWRVLLGYLRLVPGMVHERIRARPLIERRAPMRWQQSKVTAS